MKKKIVSLMLAAAMAVGMLAGCGQSKPADTGAADAAAPAADAERGGFFRKVHSARKLRRKDHRPCDEVRR